MAPSHSSPHPPPRPLPKEDVKDEVKELRSNGFWAALITVLSCLYGQLTVAKQMTPDPRQDSWLLMHSPLPALTVSLLYVAAVTWVGPFYMNNRKPIPGLRTIMMYYNACQVVFSTWLFVEAGRAGWFGRYSFICQTCDYSNNPKAVTMMHCAYWYHFSKYVDLIDTVFFVLNKKYEHMSLLHMCHHTLMPISTWYGVRYHPGGHNTFFGFLNCFVHIVMYTYYLLAAMGPSVRPYLWWKKYLTSLQMLQFTVVFFHSLQLVFIECEVPPVLMRWVGFISVMFFILFADFYIKAYRNRGQQTKPKMTGIQSDYTHEAAICASDGVVSSVSSGVSRRIMNGLCNGMSKNIPNGVPNGISNDMSNKVCNGISRSGSQAIPLSLQKEMMLRSRV
ncbi:very long chain fatty acid elongase 7-like [Panulirus ornatus]|uniref:very long chain fatty acid elongase 7-like n=1 Tax=Panulirus ornatus TaxID=150431 RepID=UPI003A8BE14D